MLMTKKKDGKLSIITNEDDKYEGLKIAYEVFTKMEKKKVNITVIMSLEKLVKKFFTKMEKRR